jgi:hypothetical protein
MAHPIQPIETDADGRRRFKGNAIVQYMLSCGRRGERFDLNALAGLGFSDEDWQQLAQLLGYTLSGYEELSYVDDAAWDRLQEKV